MTEITVENNGKVTIAVLKKDVEHLTKTVESGFDRVEKAQVSAAKHLEEVTDAFEKRLRETELCVSRHTQDIEHVRIDIKAIREDEIKPLKKTTEVWNTLNSLGAFGVLLANLLKAFGVQLISQ